MAPPGTSSESLCSAAASKTYADLSTVRDPTVDLGGIGRRIRVGGAGTVQIKYPNGTTDTITYAANAVDDVQVWQLLSGTATAVTVYV